MDNLYIQSIKNQKSINSIPEVNLRADIGVCELIGETYMENTIQFYKKILDWLTEYFENNDKSLEFNIKLTYFNTSSSRSIMDILLLLKEYKDQGKNITVNWFYDPDNKIAIKQEVEDFEEECELNMNFLPMLK